VTKLVPSSSILLKGESLSIQSTVEFYNMKKFTSNRVFANKWICPGKLNDTCRLVTGSTLRLTYDQVAASNYSFFVPQIFTYSAVPNYIQTDGSKESNSSVSITWLGVN